MHTSAANRPTDLKDTQLRPFDTMGPQASTSCPVKRLGQRDHTYTRGTNGHSGSTGFQLTSHRSARMSLFPLLDSLLRRKRIHAVLIPQSLADRKHVEYAINARRIGWSRVVFSLMDVDSTQRFHEMTKCYPTAYRCLQRKRGQRAESCSRVPPRAWRISLILSNERQDATSSASLWGL